jgi:hypothetical protein
MLAIHDSFYLQPKTSDNMLPLREKVKVLDLRRKGKDCMLRSMVGMNLTVAPTMTL